jgi:predicted lipoprotein with Yx(FWY)xxD motif
MNRILAIAATCLTGAGAFACGGDDGSSKETAAGTENTKTSATDSSGTARQARQTSSRSSGKGTRVKVMSSRYGRMLFDGNGRALYLFTRERTSRSRCYGDCAKAWPPFFTKGKPKARSGVKSSLLGTTRRRDGRLQVTYGGHPLYYYVTDRKPGQVTCQDVAEFGGTWLVVSPSGRAIR